MRVLGFAEKWDKLHLELPIEQRPNFSTFRLPRKDAPKGRDWKPAEQVQIVYHPRSPKRSYLGNAIIITVEPRWLARVTETEAKADGFPSYLNMVSWLTSTHGNTIGQQPLNKITLQWLPAPSLSKE